MTGTPDAHHGELLEDEGIVLSIVATEPTADGEIRRLLEKGILILEDGVVRPLGEGRAATWQTAVDDRDVNTPPGSPTTGYRVIIGSSPTGVFVGHGGEIAQWTGSAWVFSTPKPGMVAHVKDEAIPYRQTALVAPWTWSVFSLTPHAPTHEDNGSDELTVQNLGSGAAPAGKLLQSNGTGGWNLVDYVPGTPPELNSDLSTTPFSTSSGTYQQARRYTTPALLGGTYFIAVQAWLDTTNAGNVTDARIQIDDTTDIASWIAPVGYVGGTTPLIGVATGALSAGAHNIDFDIRKASGNGNVIIKRFYVTLWRVS
jgi:hypothetical protein